VIPVDDPKAFEVGASMGITTFQGFAVDALMKQQSGGAA
jgi:hypothetical protein